MNFSDAVVAIAITLLILPLVDIASDMGDQSPWELVEENAMKLLVFGISFVVIGRFWVGHHRMFEQIEGYTAVTIWLNMLWLMSIVFLPFPTELISSTGSGNPATIGLYIGTMLVTSLSMLALQWSFIRTPAIQRDDDAQPLELAPAAAPAMLLFIAFVTALLIPDLGLWTLFILVLSEPLTILLRRWSRRTNSSGQAHRSSSK